MFRLMVRVDVRFYFKVVLWLVMGSGIYCIRRMGTSAYGTKHTNMLFYII